MTETMQADGEQSRQAVFVRRCLYSALLSILSVPLEPTVLSADFMESL